jgi:hypothetical protein
MNHYTPDQAPSPDQWLMLDEQTRIDLIESYHIAAEIKLPNNEAHAIFHAIVENQIAEGLDPINRAMTRLVEQGLSRHDALHAVAWVLTRYLNDLSRGSKPNHSAFLQAQYFAQIERLDAKTWLSQA